jgi:hypothetical protein
MFDMSFFEETEANDVGLRVRKREAIRSESQSWLQSTKNGRPHERYTRVSTRISAQLWRARDNNISATGAPCPWKTMCWHASMAHAVVAHRPQRNNQLVRICRCQLMLVLSAPQMCEVGTNCRAEVG